MNKFCFFIISLMVIFINVGCENPQAGEKQHRTNENLRMVSTNDLRGGWQPEIDKLRKEVEVLNSEINDLRKKVTESSEGKNVEQLKVDLDKIKFQPTKEMTVKLTNKNGEGVKTDIVFNGDKGHHSDQGTISEVPRVRTNENGVANITIPVLSLQRDVNKNIYVGAILRDPNAPTDMPTVDLYNAIINKNEMENFSHSFTLKDNYILDVTIKDGSKIRFPDSFQE